MIPQVPEHIEAEMVDQSIKQIIASLSLNPTAVYKRCRVDRSGNLKAIDVQITHALGVTGCQIKIESPPGWEEDDPAETWKK